MNMQNQGIGVYGDGTKIDSIPGLDQSTEKRLIKLLDYTLQSILHNTYRYEHEKQLIVLSLLFVLSLKSTVRLADHHSDHRWIRKSRSVIGY